MSNVCVCVEHLATMTTRAGRFGEARAPGSAVARRAARVQLWHATLTPHPLSLKPPAASGDGVGRWIMGKRDGEEELVPLDAIHATYNKD